MNGRGGAGKRRRGRRRRRRKDTCRRTQGQGASDSSESSRHVTKEGGGGDLQPIHDHQPDAVGALEMAQPPLRIFSCRLQPAHSRSEDSLAAFLTIRLIGVRLYGCSAGVQTAERHRSVSSHRVNAERTAKFHRPPWESRRASDLPRASKTFAPNRQPPGRPSFIFRLVFFATSA